MPEATAGKGAKLGPGAGESESESGTLLTYTIIRKPPAAFADDGVYAVCVVDMKDGRRVTGRLDRFEPEPTMGAAVSVVGSAGQAPVFKVA